MRAAIVLLFSLSLFIQPAFCHWEPGRPDGHAPIGVMGDHMHKAGEFMLSYRFMYMFMEGSRDGNDGITDAAVIDPGEHNFMITPTQMTMQMQMLGLMFAPGDNITFTAMMPMLSLEMDHLHRNGNRFTTNSSGWGDLSVGILYSLARFGNQRIHLNAGVSIPLGSITEKDVTPASAPDETQLPYPMQTGSGTVDLLPGITYLGQNEGWSWGGQATGTIRLGKNDHDYRLGNRLKTNFWLAKRLSDTLSLSARVEGATWENIEGADPAYALAVQLRTVPTVLPDRRSGSSLDAGVGLNVYIRSGFLAGTRLALEGSIPLHQELSGPQLERDFNIIAGTQYAF